MAYQEHADAHRVLLRIRPIPVPFGPEIQAVQQRAYKFRRQTDTLSVTVNDEEYALLLAHPAVEVFPDVQLRVFKEPGDQTTSLTPASGLPHVLRRISAPEAWEVSRGANTYVAIIDTGICGMMPEFPDWKKADGISFDGSDPWDDYYGHGSMCACIAAATDREEGRFNGVAPDALLYSCKTRFTTTELIAVYEWLMDRREEHGQPIIASNSYGFESCDEPYQNGQPITINHPFATILQQAIEMGIIVVFAAGNNHSDCDGEPQDCQPDTIWAWNSLDEVLCVGTTDRNNNLWDYSSRGPGQWASAERPKPDCVAPTYGEVMWGCGFQDDTDVWGTSGAAPQAAGLAALLSSLQPTASPAAILDRIRQTCDAHPSEPTCSGHGLINCARAVAPPI
jgi:serine protease AprX